MREEDAILVELLLQSELFCRRIETVVKSALVSADLRVLRLKLSHVRRALAHLQEEYENDVLAIENPVTCADFRTLIISLMWLAFLSRVVMDRKTFRKLVLIESSFTYLLTREIRRN